jgi:hypothetical protein
MDYSHLASDESIKKTADALKANNYNVQVVDTGADALKHIKTLIPQGASVMNGASRSLEEIGFVEYLKSGEHAWNNLHATILAETDPEKQAMLRKQSVLSEYYLGSVHALVESGEFIIASNSGSQLPHIVYTSPHLIFVVGAQKIVPLLETAHDRLKNYVVPLEDERMQGVYGFGTKLNKLVTFFGEAPYTKRTIDFVLVKEKLGF